MPEFLNPFPGMVPDRKMNDRELARALRLAMAAELEAVHLYEAQADATDNALAKEVLQDIANEERVHAGEFQRLIKILLPDEQGYLDEGTAEVDEMAAAVGGGGEAAVEGPPAPSGGVPTIGDLKA
jgi:rubrerythrin